MRDRPLVLSIGTTHPWNVAGTGRDLVIGERLGARVFTAVAAVSAQDARGVRALEAVASGALAAQLEALPWDAAGAVRVGALPTAASVDLVAGYLRARPELPAVVDPVFAASKGGALAGDDARAAVRERLATLAGVVLTPNLSEAAVLLEAAEPGRDDMERAAAALQRRGARAVLLKGGHLDGDPVDVLATADGTLVMCEPRLDVRMPGTGCTLAMALACELAEGRNLAHAVRFARAFTRAEIARR